MNLTADAPLVFWSLLSLGQARKTPIAAIAVAGVSAPLCTACGIEPFAIAALSQDDTTDFGFTQGNVYTFGFQCTGASRPVEFYPESILISCPETPPLNTAGDLHRTDER